MTAEEDLRRLEELAVSRLLEPLSTDEAEEYVTLKTRLGNFDEAAIENVVALAHLAMLPGTEAVPRTLRSALEQDADEFFGFRGKHSPIAPRALPLSSTAFWARSAGWWVGLAASIVTVVVLLQRAPGERVPPVASTARPTAPVAVAPAVPPPAAAAGRERRPAAADRTTTDLASERRAFLGSHPHAIQRAWRAGGDATGDRVVGDVVWDEASQTGYMRFVNLRHNEPNTEQYQLWIFDGERDQRYPVDGGVFDVTARGTEQIIPIRPRLRIHVPLVFAVTVEHRGGVVVSDRSRIAAIANVS